MRVYNRVSRFISARREKRIIYAYGRLNEQDGDLFGLATAYIEPFPRPAVFIPSLVLYGKPGKLSGSAIHDVHIMITRDATLDGRRGKVAAQGRVITTWVQGDGELNGYPGTAKVSALAFEAQVAGFDLGVYLSAGGNTGTNVLEFSMDYPLRSNPMSTIAHEAALHLSLFRTLDTTQSKVQHDSSVPFPLPHVTGKSSPIHDSTGESVQLPISYDWSGTNTKVFIKTVQFSIDQSEVWKPNLEMSVAPEVEPDPCWFMPQGIPKIHHEGLQDLFFDARSPLARGLQSYLYPSSPDTPLAAGFWSNMPPTVQIPKGRVYNFDGTHYIRHALYPPIRNEWSVFIRFKPMHPSESNLERYLWQRIADDGRGSIDIYSNPNSEGIIIWGTPPWHVPFSAPPGKWHTLGMSYQCPKTGTLYKDGPIIIFLNGQKLTGPAWDSDCPSVEATGDIPWAELRTGRNFIGHISTVCYWQRALSVRELKVLTYDLFPADSPPRRLVLE